MAGYNSTLAQGGTDAQMLKHTSTQNRRHPAVVALMVCAVGAGCVLDWDRSWDLGAATDLSVQEKPPDVMTDIPGKPNDWAVTLGAHTYGNSAAVDLDTDDNVFVAGAYSGKITVGSKTWSASGGEDLLVSRLYATGVRDFTITSGSIGKDRCTTIHVSPTGEHFVGGYFSNTLHLYNNKRISKGSYDGLVVKLSPEGVHWVTAMGGTGLDTVTALALNPKGTKLWVTGRFSSIATFGAYKTPLTSAGVQDVFVARLDPEYGTVSWITRAGGKNIDIPSALALDKAGNVYIAGFFQNKATFGKYTLTSGGKDDDDVFVAKLSPAAGTFVWAKGGGSTANDEARGLALDSSGNVYITGYHSGPATFGGKPAGHHQGGDLFVAKLSPAGTFLWVESTSGSLDELGSAIAVDSQDRIVVAGSHEGTTTLGNRTVTSVGDRDVYLASLDTGGETLWVATGGGAKRDEALGLALDSAGRPVVTGYINGTASFKGNKISATGRDGFVWKLPLPQEAQ